MSCSLSIFPYTKIAVAQNTPSPILIASDGPKIQSEARRWTTRLTGFQWDYYRKQGVFAKTADQILSVMSPQAEDYSIDYFRTVLKQHYNFVVKETPNAIYTYAIPQSSGFMAYSSMNTFMRSQNGKFSRVASAGCHSKSATPPEPSIDSDGKQKCTAASNISDDMQEVKSKSNQGSVQDPSNNNSLNQIKKEFKKEAPRVFDNIFR